MFDVTMCHTYLILQYRTYYMPPTARLHFIQYSMKHIARIEHVVIYSSFLYSTCDNTILLCL